MNSNIDSHLLCILDTTAIKALRSTLNANEPAIKHLNFISYLLINSEKITCVLLSYIIINYALVFFPYAILMVVSTTLQS